MHAWWVAQVAMLDVLWQLSSGSFPGVAGMQPNCATQLFASQLCPDGQAHPIGQHVSPSAH
jgi:hypothetical protein